jgi:hypothetical protein
MWYEEMHTKFCLENFMSRGNTNESVGEEIYYVFTELSDEFRTVLWCRL